MTAIFADLDLAITGYLRDALAAREEACAADVQVSVKVPNPRLDRMVIVRRDGGRRTGPVLETARIGVQVWGATFEECSALCALVRALLTAMPDGDPVCAVEEVLAPSPVDDPSGQPLRFGTYLLTARGADFT